MNTKSLLFWWFAVCGLPAISQTSCPNVYDSNGDGAVTITDLIGLLIVYGDLDIDQDYIWDSVDSCEDLNACNYAANPTEPCVYEDVLGVCGGDCDGDVDNDGVCDSVDNCVGFVDECGVCNGPGPTEMVIEDITILYDSVFLDQIGEWYVYEYGADTTYSFTCGPYLGDCGDPISYQGYDYATVLIGNQCWFAENLRNENYDNGDAIPSSLSQSAWSLTNAGAVSVFGEGNVDCEANSPDGDGCDELWSLSEYGRLYNWYAVDDARGLCPAGWHVPTDDEWMTLEMALGMSLSVASETGYRGTDQGTQMKSDYGWFDGNGQYDGNNGTNSSGFNGLPGGVRNIQKFALVGYYGYWWSSSSFAANEAWFRAAYGYNEDVYRSDVDKRSGFSVRCVRDAE